jgi:uncharacterized membrane-anchored protein YhcB (DUF1043 family)
MTAWFNNLASLLDNTITSGNFTKLLNFYAGSTSSAVYTPSYIVPTYQGPFSLAPTIAPTSNPNTGVGASQLSSTSTSSVATMSIVIPIVVLFIMLCCAVIIYIFYKRHIKQQKENEKEMSDWFDSGRGELQVFKKKSELTNLSSYNSYFTDIRERLRAPSTTLRDYMYQPDIFDIYDTKNKLKQQQDSCQTSKEDHEGQRSKNSSSRIFENDSIHSNNHSSILQNNHNDIITAIPENYDNNDDVNFSMMKTIDMNNPTTHYLQYFNNPMIHAAFTNVGEDYEEAFKPEVAGGGN